MPSKTRVRSIVGTIGSSGDSSTEAERAKPHPKRFGPISLGTTGLFREASENLGTLITMEIVSNYTGSTRQPWRWRTDLSQLSTQIRSRERRGATEAT